MPNKEIKIIETETYKKSLEKLKDKSVILAIQNRVDKLKENPSIAEPMAKQHSGICEIRVGSKYRVYCIKAEEILAILFILGPAVHHKYNYENNQEYQKLFNQMRIIEEEFRKINKT